MLLAVLSEEHVNRLVEAVEAVEAVEDLKEHVNSLKKTASRFTNRLTKTSGKTSGKRAARLAQLVRNAGQQEVELLVKHGGQQSSASTAGYASEATSGNTTGTSALDFRVDNPLANVRDAGAGAAVAVAVAVAGRPQSATFVAVPPTDKFSRIAMTGSSHNEGSHTRPCTTPGDGTRNRGSSWMSTDMRTAARSVSRRGTGEDGSTSVTERGTEQDESTSTNLRRTTCSIEVGEDEKM